MSSRTVNTFWALVAAITLLAAGAGTLPPIPGSIPSVSGGPVGRQPPPPLVRVPPPPPPPPKTSSTARPGDRGRGGTSIIVRSVTVAPGERVEVWTGPAALRPGSTLLDVTVPAGGETRHLLVAVIAVEGDLEAGAAPLVVIRR